MVGGGVVGGGLVAMRLVPRTPGACRMGRVAVTALNQAACCATGCAPSSCPVAPQFANPPGTAGAYDATACTFASWTNAPPLSPPQILGVAPLAAPPTQRSSVSDPERQLVESMFSKRPYCRTSGKSPAFARRPHP